MRPGGIAQRRLRESATAKVISLDLGTSLFGIPNPQNNTASTSSGTKSLVSASSAPNGVAFMRWSTRNVQKFKQWDGEKQTRAASRLNRPRRMIAARSQSMQACTDESTARPTTAESRIPVSVKPDAKATDAPNINANATIAKAIVIITAPFRVALFVGSERYASAATPNSISERRYVSFCPGTKPRRYFWFSWPPLHPPHTHADTSFGIMSSYAIPCSKAAFDEIFGKRIDLRIPLLIAAGSFHEHATAPNCRHILIALQPHVRFAYRVVCNAHKSAAYPHRGQFVARFIKNPMQ